MSEERNMILAVVISFLILFGFHYFTDQQRIQEIQDSSHPIPEQTYVNNIPTEQKTLQVVDRKEALAQTPRVSIHSDTVSGSINLKGARLDDLALSLYKETTDENSDTVKLMSPEPTQNPYFVNFSWKTPHLAFEQAQNTDPTPQTAFTPSPSVSSPVSSPAPFPANNVLPDAEALWEKTSGTQLTPDSPVTLRWKGPSGLTVERTFSMDRHYMITVTDKITNSSPQTVQLQQQIDIVQTPLEKARMSSVFEGMIGCFDDKIQEVAFDKLDKEHPFTAKTAQGWAGFTDKYWLTSYIIRDVNPVTVTVTKEGEQVRCQAETAVFTLQPESSLEYKSSVFAGAKVLKVLDGYKQKGIKKFDLAVDFGWFYFLTKPLFYLLNFLSSLLGNLALAIILLTILSKIALYPFARKTYLSMDRMKLIQPKIELLKKRYGNDKMKMNEEMLKLYRKEKINPASGCLPLLIQMPIFFCLYKVFAISIEMRHTPLCLWIKDLAAPDPTSLFNLFGLLPWTPPSFLQIGVLPLIMGGTMFLQQKLSPQPTDPTQAKMMYIMPLIFLFMFSAFPSGLVLYWTVSNILSIIQQYFLTGKKTQKAA